MALVFAACSNVPEVSVQTTECASMPEGRASACACVCDGKAYVFGGRNEKGTYQNDLWQYDPSTDTWTSLGASPMKARVNATMTSADDKLYVGLGYSAPHAYSTDAYQKDWWEYNLSTGQWKQLADYPNAYTVAALSMSIDDAIYVIYGFGFDFTQYICRYDIVSDSWSASSQNATYRPKKNAGGRGALCGGLYYFGGGYDTHNLNHWYAADIAKDKWTACASFPGKGREFGACAASEKFVYWFGGRYFGGDMTGGEIFDTYMRYSPEKDEWEWCGKMPCGRAENLIAFTINNKVYFGLGENENGQVMKSLFRIEN